MGNTKSKTLVASPSSMDEEEDAAVVEVAADTPEQAPTAGAITTTTTPKPTISRTEDAKLLGQVSTAFAKLKKSKSSTERQLGKLRKYCNSNSAKAVHYLRHILAYENGLDMIIAAMKRHVKSATIQDHGCRVCTMLARQDAAATMCTLEVVLAAMTNHKRNTNIQLNGLAALSFWGMDLKEGAPIADPSNQDKLASQVVEAGAYPVIFNTMMNSWHETNFLLQDKALKTLVILTTSGGATSDNRTAFVSAGAWKALQTSLSNHSTKAKLQLKGIKILRAIAVEHPAAVSKRGLPAVVAAMKTHIDDPAVQKHGCSLLLLLATNHPPSHDLLWQPGGGRDAILAAMQQHTSHEDIQKTAILALQKLPSQNNDNNINNNDPTSPTNSNTSTTNTQSNNQTSDAISQGMVSMIASLQKEETATNTLTNICKALIRLATESHTNKLDIASAAGVEAILAAMQRRVDAQSLQRYGCQALTQLAAVEATKRAIVQEANAIPVIVQAMETHTIPNQSHLVTLHGILLLVRLSQLLANHAKMMPTVVPVLILGMEVHPDHTQIQHKAMVVLHKLAGRFARFKKPIVKAGGLEVILEAMTRHPDHTPIQRLGCQCLCSLHHRSTSQKMVQEGALLVIVSTMQRHRTHIGIQMAAIRAIAEITQFTCHLEHWASRRVNGLPCLVVSIQMHFDNVAFQQLAFGVLQQSSRHYARCGPYLQRQLVQAGGIGAIMACMKDHHPDHPVIQQTGFRTLHNLVSRGNARYGAIIFKNGGWKLVRQAQRVCAEDEFLQRYAATLLVKLVVMFILHWFMWVAFHVV